LVVLEFELRALCLLGRCSTARAALPFHFGLVILEMRSHKLFAWAGLKPRSSQSQPPQELGLQTCVTSTWLMLYSYHNKINDI
jgi:hypothetical protein